MKYDGAGFSFNSAAEFFYSFRKIFHKDENGREKSEKNTLRFKLNERSTNENFLNANEMEKNVEEIEMMMLLMRVKWKKKM